MVTVYLTSLGCKLNQAEVEALARRVEAAGHAVVADPWVADWAVINTCAVTHVAARKSRQLVRRLRQSNPALRVAVIGCYAETSPGEAAALGVDLVVPNGDKEQVLERILGYAPVILDGLSSRPAGGRTRALVKIQDGCDNHCAYCLVRVARGPSRSRPPQEVLAEVGRRLDEGYREVVLTGVSIGAYGRDSGPGATVPCEAGWTLARLAGEILRRIGAARLRLSSVEPWDVTPELVDLWAHPRLCRHVHLPLQSGCDETLRRMGRGYTVAGYEETVDMLRRRVPGVAVTTDLIVGFPGETETEFHRTAGVVERLSFARLHVFRYSSRPGTPAAGLAGAVDPLVARERSDIVGDIGRRSALAFHRRLVGQEVEVLFETSEACDGVDMWSGLTDHYVRVTATGRDDLANTLAMVRCISADEAGCHASLLPVGG
jgi:threonylcarbamoyladenosine tRNA methylthiotransferase MtaB